MKVKTISMFFNVAALITFFCLGFVSACSALERNHDPGLTSEIEEFSRNIKVPERDLKYVSVRFYTTTKDKNFSPSTIGVCYQLVKEVKIDPTYFFKASYIKKKSLLWHELAHCACGLKHINSFMDDACPTSLMYAYTISNRCLNKHWGEYVTELRKQCQGR